MDSVVHRDPSGRTGCSIGFVLFDSVYEQPGCRTNLLIGRSLTYEQGRWLVIQDQNTRVA